MPQVIPPVDHRGKPRGKGSRNEFPDTFSSIYGVRPPYNLFNYRAGTCGTALLHFIPIFAPRTSETATPISIGHIVMQHRINAVIEFFQIFFSAIAIQSKFK